MLKCFFGNIDIEPINGKGLFEFLKCLVGKIASRNMRLSTFIFGTYMINYRLRKIDKEIYNNIQDLKEYTKKVINRIVEKVNGDGRGANQNQGLIAKLIRENKLVS